MVEMLYGLPSGFIRQTADKLRLISKAEVDRALKDFLEPSRFLLTILTTANADRALVAEATGVPEADIQVIPYTTEAIAN